MWNHFPAQSDRSVARGRRGGFSLIELVFVLLVLAVLVGMALPALQGMGESQAAKDTASQLLALTRYARAQSASEGVPYRLVLDIDGRNYFLARQDGNDYLAIGEAAGQAHPLPEGVRMEYDDAAAQQNAQQQQQLTGTLPPDRPQGGPPYVQFYPTGRTDPVTIRVIDVKGRIIQIVCPSATELFRIVTPDGTAIQ